MLGRRRRVLAEGQDCGMARWTVRRGVALYLGPLEANERCRSLIHKAALRHYMHNFDFSNLRLDQAFRCVARHGAV